jgi:nifR3 family TIM-barrel protein
VKEKKNSAGPAIKHPYDALEPNPLILAPLAEITHVAFRMLIRRMGGCDLFYTEMLSSTSLVRGNPDDSLFLLQDPEEQGLIHQLSGSDPGLMAEAASLLAQRGVKSIDINMGCSAPLIVRKGEGIALMKSPPAARSIVRSVRRSFPGHLSVKIRLGWEESSDQLLSFTRMLCDEGVQTIVLHPRLKNEKFKRRARWDWIRLLVDNTPVPIVGNGDVFTPEDHRRLVARTRCGGVMMGRGAVRDPFLFRRIRGAEEPELPPPELIHMFINLLKVYLPDTRRLSRLKIFLHWYSQSIFFGHTLFSKVQKTNSLGEAEQTIQGFFEETDQ